MTDNETGMYVNYGCGTTAPEGWLNFDASLSMKLERVPIVGHWLAKNPLRFPDRARFGDIVKGLPVPDGSCKGVYASHVLEHLALEDFHRALQNTRKMMAPGAILRVVVPDLELAAREYLIRLESGDPSANSYFMRETSLGREKRDSGVLGLAQGLFSKARHHWMWDARSLENALAEHGFRDMRRCCFGDSEDPMFRLVEVETRFERAVAIQAIRP